MPSPTSTHSTLHVAAYARASLDHPDPQEQLARLEELAADLSLPTPTPFIDTQGHAATPAWSHLLAACSRGEVGVILVVAFHRFAGSIKQLTRTLDRLNARGVRLISEGDQFDSATSRGRIAHQLVSCFVSFEEVGRSERVREGQEQARRQGRRPGRRSCSGGEGSLKEGPGLMSASSGRYS